MYGADVWQILSCAHDGNKSLCKPCNDQMTGMQIVVQSVVGTRLCDVNGESPATHRVHISARLLSLWSTTVDYRPTNTWINTRSPVAVVAQDGHGEEFTGHCSDHSSGLTENAHGRPLLQGALCAA